MNELKKYINKDVDGTIAQETWNHYEKITNGNVSSRVIVKDIKSNFRKIISGK